MNQNEHSKCDERHGGYVAGEDLKAFAKSRAVNGLCLECGFADVCTHTHRKTATIAVATKTTKELTGESSEKSSSKHIK